MSTSRIIRKFERFLFKGIPEQPEPVWERDANTNVRERHTGKSHTSLSHNESNHNSNIIGYFTFDFDKQTEEYTSIL